VVVFLGHVDAGKSSLLDHIRETNVAEKEAGSITQHVYAYQMKYEGKDITFIDTPGHKAFSSIRERGAQVADIAVLVVAANEGVQAQTEEAISYIKDVDLPCIVALNKIDLNSADLNKARGQLVKEDIVVESRGGQVPEVETSAETGEGVDHLMELIDLVAEMEELKADYDQSAQGYVLESYLDSQRGPVAKLIIRDGVLHPGDILGTASTWGRIKGIFDYQQQNIKQALPSQPVEVLGFNQSPLAGEKIKYFESEGQARQQAQEEVVSSGTVSEEAVFNLILKADVQSSLEALESVLSSFKEEINIIHQGLGNVTKKDVQIAHDAPAQILAFRTEVDSGAQGALQRYEVEIKDFDVIYRLSQYVQEQVEERKEPEETREKIGRLKVLAVFKHGPGRQIFGGDVISGRMEQGAHLEIFRGKEKVGQGKIIRLEQQKKQKEVVNKGSQAGILYDGSGAVEKGDIIEAYIN